MRSVLPAPWAAVLGHVLASCAWVPGGGAGTRPDDTPRIASLFASLAVRP